MKTKTYRISALAEQIRGVSYEKQDASKNLLPDYVPILRAGNITDSGIIFEDLVYIPSTKVSAKQMIQKDDIIIAASSGSLDVVGKAARVVVDFNGSFGAFCKVLRPSKKVNAAYFSHYFKTSLYRTLISSLAVGANINNLRNSDLDNLEIPLPPLAEQKRIAAILDAADALRAKRRESIALLDTLLQSTFLDMFGDPVTNPMGWEVKKLKEISTHIMSGTTPKGGKQVYVEEGIIFFRSQNVWRNRLVLDDVAYIDNETHQKMRKSSLKNKDILITKTGRFNTENSSLGRAVMFLGQDDSANINGHVYLIRLKKTTLHEFVLYILTTNEYREYIRRVCVGGIDKRQINKEHLEEFPIIFPPLDLQRRFAAIVKAVEYQKTLLRAHLAELDTLFASLQQRAFKGEL